MGLHAFKLRREIFKMTTPQDIQAALDEISETLHTLLDRCPRQAYDDLGKIYQSAQSRVDDLRELQSHVAAHDVVDLEAIKRELRGVIFPYSAVEKVIDHLAPRLARSEWKDISTAPRDRRYLGVIVTKSGASGEPFVCEWDEDDGHICQFQTEAKPHKPTHWRDFDYPAPQQKQGE